jgi:hypothetical protein
MTEHVFGAAYPAAALLEQVHHTQIRDRVDPENTDGISGENAQIVAHSVSDLREQVRQYTDRLVSIGAEMDGQHLSYQHLESRQWADVRTENKPSEFGQEPPDAVRLADTIRQSVIVKTFTGQ